MLFNSLEFLVFFPIVLLMYYVLPQKIKNIWLLLSSYYFYMCWNAKYVLFILFSTIITYFGGILLERVKQVSYDTKKQTILLKSIVGITICSNLAVLLYFKYTNFLLDIVKNVFLMIGVELNIPVFDILLPVGISFYTFQVVGYIIDVYRGTVSAETNFLQYALFVSFFPQILAGPIGRANALLPQLNKARKFKTENIAEGLLLMLWGFFLKIVLSDRVAIFVDTVYGDYHTYGGWYLMIATLLFAVQIYCDFCGYSTIAVGAAKMLGISLTENFNAPYLSTSVAEFWRKWHISLTSWFKDYLYIPLGGSRRGKFRKNINKLVVFLVSGLWHGAQITYIVWGALNGIYQILGEVLQPVRDKIIKMLRLNRESLGHKCLQMTGTFLLVDFSWIFFRADTMTDAVNIITQMIMANNPWIMFDGSLYQCGLERKNFALMLVCIAIMILADFCRMKGIKIREIVLKQDDWVKWIVIVFTVCAILLFGIWGPGYDSANFIYFQF